MRRHHGRKQEWSEQVSGHSAHCATDTDLHSIVFCKYLEVFI